MTPTPLHVEIRDALKKATPRPWIVGRDGNDERRFKITVPGALSTALPIATVYPIEIRKPFGMETVPMSGAANAQAIIALVNSADRLLARAEAIETLLKKARWKLDEWVEIDAEGVNLIDEIDTALAAGREEEGGGRAS